MQGWKGNFLFDTIHPQNDLRAVKYVCWTERNFKDKVSSLLAKGVGGRAYISRRRRR